MHPTDWICPRSGGKVKYYESIIARVSFNPRFLTPFACPKNARHPADSEDEQSAGIGIGWAQGGTVSGNPVAELSVQAIVDAHHVV
jgi:hypothetical protein